MERSITHALERVVCPAIALKTEQRDCIKHLYKLTVVKIQVSFCEKLPRRGSDPYSVRRGIYGNGVLTSFEFTPLETQGSIQSFNLSSKRLQIFSCLYQTL